MRSTQSEVFIQDRQQATRPNQLTNLMFDLNLDAIPEDFVQADISVQGRRHFLLATTYMISLRLSAKNWFVDGTFKVVRAPFVQLFFIHAFIRQGDNLKQIPLVYFLMSGKSSKDYEAIFIALFRLLPRRNLGVKNYYLGLRSCNLDCFAKGTSFGFLTGLFVSLEPGDLAVYSTTGSCQ